MTQASKIRVLSDQTINKIAAGEVIENPSSVVKELVENSVDAGATEVCVEIQEGGRQLIRVSDNGSGMTHDDALLCLERHATSKIKEVEDIQDLLTMGFRGEAIPSIAAISKFTLLTCPQTTSKQAEGTLILVDGGRLLSCSAAARSPGTTIEVKALFFNVPVRRKFQKSPSYDTQEIVKIMGTLALSYPSIQFELISDQKSAFKTPLLPSPCTFQEQLSKRIETILGKEFATSLLPLHFEQTPYELEGYIGQPTQHKANRTGQYLFINQRAVYSPLIGVTIREGYGTMLPSNRYPVFVLHLRLPGTLMDVNVHPQKKEVRLRQEQALKSALIQAVQRALRQEETSSLKAPKEERETPIPDLTAPYSSLLSPFFPIRKKDLYQAEGEWEFKANPTCPSFFPSSEDTLQSAPLPPFSSSSALSPSPLSLRAKPTSSEPAPRLLDAALTLKAPRVLMTLFGYIAIDSFALTPKQCPSLAQKEGGGLCLVDQRAAYARIYYERLLKRSCDQEGEIQPLLIPLTLQFSACETALLQEHLEALNRMGFSLREFGEHTFLLDACPTILGKEDPAAWLSAIVRDLTEKKETRLLQMKKEEQLALAASRSSLPQDKRLNLEEAQALIDQLYACAIPFQCPFGKSTLWYVSPCEIAHYFH